MSTPLFSETDAEMLYFMPKVEATPKKIAWLFASCNRVAEPEREVMMDFLNKAVANGIVRACPNDRYVVCEVGYTIIHQFDSSSKNEFEAMSEFMDALRK